MSKYEPLKRYLSEHGGAEVVMSFRDVEAILGFALPRSARRYPAWWSNNVGTHVNAAAWREAGWKTSRIDLGGERVVFVRDAGGVQDSAAPFIHQRLSAAKATGGIVLRPENMSRTAMRMIDDWAEESGLDRAGAVAALLDRAAAARRRDLMETLSVARMPAGYDSTALIREDRDAR
jgi:hypothetical protein